MAFTSSSYSPPQTKITVVANYSALPDPTTVSGKFYWAEASQGTSWLPGSLGGTYYNSGMYYSNGVSWTFMNVPYQATQAEVNTGTNNDKFVTPSTFTNASKWGTKQDSLTETNFGAFENGLTAKNTLVDADSVSSVDSADSNKAKKTTWLNVWTNYIKVKADALYATISNLALKQDKATATTGAVISFVTPQVYNSIASPTTSNITDNLTGAIIGVVQKIYHNHSVAPTFPAGWVRRGDGEYVVSTLNIIYAEWSTGTTVEYWISQ